MSTLSLLKTILNFYIPEAYFPKISIIGYRVRIHYEERTSEGLHWTYSLKFWSRGLAGGGKDLIQGFDEIWEARGYSPVLKESEEEGELGVLFHLTGCGGISSILEP